MTTDWRARVLEQVDLDERAMVQAAATLVRTPSVSGTDAEHLPPPPRQRSRRASRSGARRGGDG